MALKSIVENIDDVPEGLRDHYKEDGGVFVLDTDASDKVREFRSNNINLLKDRDELKTKLEAFGDVDAETIRGIIEEREKIERQELLKKGDVDALIAQAEKKFNAKLEAVQGENAELKSSLVKLKVTDELTKAAGAARVRPEALDDAVALAAREWELQDGTAVRIKGGEPVLSSKQAGENQSMAEYFDELAQSKPFYFEPSSGGGGQESRRSDGVRVLKNPSGVEMGKHAAEIESGEVLVEFD